MFSSRRAVAPLVLLAITGLATACGGDSTSPPSQTNNGSGPEAPKPITDVTATAVSISTIRVTFTARSTDNSYSLERAEGSGSFSAITSIPAPGTITTLTYTDANLKQGTQYRYRVIAIANGLSSSPSSESSATTLVTPTGGSGAADITGDITASRTLRADTTYTLKGFIHVTNGATLTIQAGTVVKGDFNTVGSALYVMRGAKIQAIGTADAPIVFTSSRPAGARQPGDWGGIVIVGNAPINRTGSIVLDGTGSDGATQASGKNYQIVYSGGSSPADNSGTLSYVRVEFAGYAPLGGTSGSGFTFAAVGSATHVSYLQSVASAGDGFKFLGGAPDGDHLVAYESGDDMFSMADGFSGRLQYLLGYNAPSGLTARSGSAGASADAQGIESDGCNGAGCDNGFNQQPFTVPLVANFTLVGCGVTGCAGANGGLGLLLRRGSGGLYVNGVESRFPAAALSMRDLETFVRAGSVATPDLSKTDLALRNIYFTEVNNTPFQIGTLPTLPPQFALDLQSNALVLGSAISQSLFAALPTPTTTPADASALDWTPSGPSVIASGGMASFSGRILERAGSFVTATTYRGAADPSGAKWWTKWTVYVRS